MLFSLLKPTFEKRPFDIAGNSINLTRIICGLFFLPHAWAKLTQFGPHVVFFSNVGLNPAPFFVILALILELFIGILFTIGFSVRLIGIIAIVYLLAASAADIISSGFHWGWSAGGIEYAVFWILCVLSVVINSFKRR